MANSRATPLLKRFRLTRGFGANAQVVNTGSRCTARSNTKKSDAEYGIATWAACSLATLHPKNSELFQDYRQIWAQKPKPISLPENSE
ncbi:hypothetical protein GS625_14345 [Ruegeria sp. HKCCD7319]|nr:hypothetical protein [Ruegeria sp. HKCCD7319]